jgi:hypothetical protein
MKKICALIYFVCVGYYSTAQFKNSIWCFGDSSGIDFSNVLVPIPFITSLDTRGTAVSIADSINNLLFYANTRAGLAGNTALVWDKNHQLMQNGDSIVGRAWYKELIIIPLPDSQNLFYVFSSGETSIYGLYYSIINLNLNGGLGAVVQKNTQLLPYQGSDGIAAIKHGNGRDWWLFFRRWDIPNNSFYTYLITPNGIIPIPIQQLGSVATNAGFYRIEPSWDGTKLACVTAQGIIEVFDFDRCTGIISSPVIIDSEQPTGNSIPWYWSCELSLDKSKLYVMSVLQGSIQDTSYLFQFDMNAPNINASRDTIHIFNTPTQPGAIELAPDGKMYISSAYEWGGFSYPYPDSVYNLYNMNLSVINYPDSLDPSCDFQPFSFYLGGKRTYYGLPNNPNYELEALVGSPCDTLSVEVFEAEIKVSAQLIVFFHGIWNTAFINAQNLKGKLYSLHIFDVLGNELFKENGNINSQYFSKDFQMQNFSNGMYIVCLQTEKESLVKKFIKN